MVEEGLHEYTEEKFDLSKCDMGKKLGDILGEFLAAARTPTTYSPNGKCTGWTTKVTVKVKGSHEQGQERSEGCEAALRKVRSFEV